MPPSTQSVAVMRKRTGLPSGNASRTARAARRGCKHQDSSNRRPGQRAGSGLKTGTHRRRYTSPTTSREGPLGRGLRRWTSAPERPPHAEDGRSTRLSHGNDRGPGHRSGPLHVRTLDGATAPSTTFRLPSSNSGTRRLARWRSAYTSDGTGVAPAPMPRARPAVSWDRLSSSTTSAA